MPVRKPTNTSQFDLFAALPPGPVLAAVLPKPPPKVRPPNPANDQPKDAVRPRLPPPSASPAPLASDEWWTTRMACSFLKISRKTLWERRRDPTLSFPQPVQLGGTRNLYRASAIRGWAESMAAGKHDGGDID